MRVRVQREEYHWSDPAAVADRQEDRGEGLIERMGMNRRCSVAACRVDARWCDLSMLGRLRRCHKGNPHEAIRDGLMRVYARWASRPGERGVFGEGGKEMKKAV